MKQLLAIGEALIDFAPEETGKELKDVSAFKPKVGALRRMSAALM